MTKINENLILHQTSGNCRRLEFLAYLIKQDLKINYRGKVLGYFWLILQPLIFAYIFVFVRNNFVFNAHEHKVDFINMFAVFIMWQFMVISLQRCLGSIRSNISLTSKFKFSAVLLPISVVLSSAFGTILNILFLFFIAVIVKKSIFINILFLLPVLFISVIFVSALCILFSIFECFVKDVRNIIPIFNRVSLFLLPILYNVSEVPEHMRKIYQNIPLVWMISYTKKVLVGLENIEWNIIVNVILISLVSYLIAYLIFRSLERLIKIKA